jgi:hypothetical protein
MNRAEYCRQLGDSLLRQAAIGKRIADTIIATGKCPESVFDEFEAEMRRYNALRVSWELQRIAGRVPA